MPAPDFWYWMPGIFEGACPAGAGGAPSWQVAGHQADLLGLMSEILPDWMLALPFVTNRERTLEQGALWSLGSGGGVGTRRVRAAVYGSRGPRCGYPGDLLIDLGTVEPISPGAFNFPGGAGGTLPANSLLWVVSWWERQHPAAIIPPQGAYPVLQFDGPAQTVPDTGWALSAAWDDEVAHPWDDPFPDDAGRLRVDGTTALAMDPPNLPAIFLLQS